MYMIDRFTISECADFPKLGLVSLQPRGNSEMASCIIIIHVTMAYSGTSLHEDNFVDSFAAQYPYCQCNLQCVSPCLWFEADWVRGWRGSCFLCVLLARSSAFHSISLEDIFVTCFVSPSPLVCDCAIVAASINGMEGIACEMSMLHAVLFF